MIRKTIIVVLTLAAVACLSGGLASRAMPVAMTAYSNEQESKYLGLRVEGGLLMLVWVVSSSRSCLSPTARFHDGLPVASLAYSVEPWDGGACVVINETGKALELRSFSPFGIRPPQGGTKKQIYVGVHFALMLAVLAAYPVFAFTRGPFRRWRRRRKGLCLNCGYDLTGNVTGVCSECGVEVEGNA